MMIFSDVTETHLPGQRVLRTERGWTCIFSKTVFSAQDLKFLVISLSLAESHAKSFLLFIADVEGYDNLGVECSAFGGRRKRGAG